MVSVINREVFEKSRGLIEVRMNVIHEEPQKL
jgi:hypothetical protein